jgi:hypothetical protein
MFMVPLLALQENLLSIIEKEFPKSNVSVVLKDLEQLSKKRGIKKNHKIYMDSGM